MSASKSKEGGGCGCLALIGIALLFSPLFIVFGAGATFGQRCAHAYPDSGLQQERCVWRLQRGQQP